MKAQIFITLKNGVLDPQGQAVAASLKQNGFANVGEVRVGKFVELEVDAASKDEAKTQVAAMCEKLIANTVIESYRVEIL